MRTLFLIVTAAAIMLMPFGGTWAASEQAMKMRAQSDLSEYSPPEAFLNGNFIADEVDPAYIFGKVSDFAKSRACQGTWLIESGERNRLQKQGQESTPFEYTLYLEEDCAGKVVYYVFVDRSLTNSAKWLEWRKQFHKSKAEPHYGAAMAALEQAAQNGITVEGELRFVEIGGDLMVKKTEDFLMSDLKVKPIYDFKQAKPAAK